MVVKSDTVASAKTNTCDGPKGGTDTDELSIAGKCSAEDGV